MLEAETQEEEQEKDEVGRSQKNVDVTLSGNNLTVSGRLESAEDSAVTRDGLGDSVGVDTGCRQNSVEGLHNARGGNRSRGSGDVHSVQGTPA